MKYSPEFLLTHTKGLSTGLLLALATAGCTQDPPGPTIVDTPVEAPEPVNSEARDYAAYDQLQWEDNFDGSSLDATKWKPEVQNVWYNNELQATTADRSNLTVTGGNLVITAKKEPLNGRNYTSARIVTEGLKSFNFGRIDVRAKLPRGKGIWPAIWMLGSNEKQVSWPACGEIDIMELKGSDPTTIYSTLHYGATVAEHQIQGTAYPLPAGGNVANDYHIYSVVRSLDQIRWYVDGVLYYTRTPATVTPYPFNNPFYMILNVAVGGDFDGDPDASTQFPQQMQVDYVKYFKYKE